VAGRQVHKPRDDAHIFCAREQLAGELASLLAFVLRLLRTFGLTEFEAELATRPEKFVGARRNGIRPRPP
jgi:threonyl-tRNA synthetase